MKSIIKIATAVLAVGMAATIAGCSGCSGCSSNVKNTALTNSNWYTGTSYKGIQPYFIADEDHPEYTKEIMNYDVTFTSPSVGNSTYSAEYKDGSLRTEFYATTFDWYDQGLAKLPEEYRPDPDSANTVETVYYYRTEFKISVRFTMRSGDTSDWMDDSVVNECYFRSAGLNLQPIYSKQTIKSASPATLQPANLEAAYTMVDVEYENFYNYTCTQVTTFTTENGVASNEALRTGLSKIKTSLFDNSSLYIAVRSLKLSSSLSQSFSLYSALSGGVSSFSATGSDSALSEDESKTVTEALSAEGIGLFAATEGVPTVPTVAVSVNYTGGDLSGTTQTIWYAAIQDADNNTARAAMLKISIPLSFNLGTLDFTLKEVESAIWNG